MQSLEIPRASREDREDLRQTTDSVFTAVNSHLKGEGHKSTIVTVNDMPYELTRNTTGSEVEITTRRDNDIIGYYFVQTIRANPGKQSIIVDELLFQRGTFNVESRHVINSPLALDIADGVITRLKNP